MTLTFPIVTATQKTLVAVAVLLCILPAVAIALRFLSHRLAYRALTASDYFAAVAAAFAIGFEASTIVAVVYGAAGYAHQTDIVQEYGNGPVETLKKTIFSYEFIWAASMSLSKTSVLLLYLQVFRDSYVVLASKITLVVTSLWPVATILVALLICHPIVANWKQIAGSKCGDQVTFYFVSGLINIITDFVVVCLPLPQLYRLRLPQDSKMGLIVVFGLGFVTCIIGTIRLPYLLTIDWTDLPWSVTIPTILTALEPSLAVTLACVPLLKPILGLGRRTRGMAARRRKTRRRAAAAAAGNDLRTHQYDPDHVARLKLRADRVLHTARVESVAPGSPGGSAGAQQATDTEDSMWELKAGGAAGPAGAGPEITVNRQWWVTSEKAGDWTQMLGTRS